MLIIVYYILRANKRYTIGLTIKTELLLERRCYQRCKSANYYTGWAKKTGLFLRVDNFAIVGGRNACDMSKFSKFYPEKNLKLACQCVKYSLPNLHKYSMSLKLR